MNRAGPILAITLLVLTASALAWGEDGEGTVKGGATTTVAGGTGAPSYVPVITKLTFHWRDGQGRFECLALAPSALPGSPGSGNFDTNAMYETGTITGVHTNGTCRTLTGPATREAVGAGSDVPFTAAAEL